MDRSQLRAPFPYFGGKSKAASLIWERLGDVSNYVEPFAGSLAVLLRRPHPPRVETVNDVDAMVSNFWRALAADAEQVAHHVDWPVSEPDLHARHRALVEFLPVLRERLLADPEHYDAKVAGWWCWGLSQWIGGAWCSAETAQQQRRPRISVPGSGGTACVHAEGLHKKRPHLGTQDSGAGKGVHRLSLQIPRCHGLGGMGVHGTRVLDAPRSSAARTEAIFDWFAELQNRLRRVRVCCGDWTRIMGPSVILGNSFTGIVLDPPYKGEERTRKLYAEDPKDRALSEEARAWAIEQGGNARLRIALCGYESEHEMPPGWTCEQWSAPSGYGGGKQRHRERIWFSPHCLRPAASAPAPERREQLALSLASGPVEGAS